MNILNTRPTHQSRHLTTLLENNHHIVFHLPLIDIQPIRFDPIDITIFNHVIFTSANAVMHFFKTVTQCEFTSVIAIGPSTKRALENHGIPTVICPKEFSSEGLLSLPILQNVTHQNIAIVCGENPKSLLQHTLQERGATTHTICCYRRVLITYDMTAIFPRLQSQKIDVIISASGETLSALLIAFQDPLYHHWLFSKTLCVISDEMKKAAYDAGFESVVVADNATDAAIVCAIVR